MGKGWLMVLCPEINTRGRGKKGKRWTGREGIGGKIDGESREREKDTSRIDDWECYNRAK